MVSGFFEGNRERTEKTLNEPSLYTIGNWLTLGFLEQGKEALFPEKPLSLQHWLSAIGFAAAYEVYSIASGQNVLTRLYESGPEIRPSWQRSEIDFGKKHLRYQRQVHFLTKKRFPAHQRDMSRRTFIKKDAVLR